MNDDGRGGARLTVKALVDAGLFAAVLFLSAAALLAIAIAAPIAVALSAIADAMPGRGTKRGWRIANAA